MSLSVCFWHSDKPRERVLADAFLRGVSAHGDFPMLRRLEPEPQVQTDADVAIMVGVKSKRLYDMHAREGVHLIMLDKGYIRRATSGALRAWEYWRAAVDAHHPTRYLERENYPFDRLERLEVKFRPWRWRGEHVLFAGSSAKYHDFYSLPDPTSYARKQIRRLSKLTTRPLVYRPKPSWKEAEPVEGATFQQGGSIVEALDNAWALVTHGSNAVWEAVLYGVPTIVLGDAVSKPISSLALEDIENPRLALLDERMQWAANLAYQQWTLPEMASGEAWATIRKYIYV